MKKQNFFEVFTVTLMLAILPIVANSSGCIEEPPLGPDCWKSGICIYLPEAGGTFCIKSGDPIDDCWLKVPCVIE